MVTMKAGKLTLVPWPQLKKAINTWTKTNANVVLWDVWVWYFFLILFSFFLTQSVPLFSPKIPWAAFKIILLDKQKTNLKTLKTTAKFHACTASKNFPLQERKKNYRSPDWTAKGKRVPANPKLRESALSSLNQTQSFPHTRAIWIQFSIWNKISTN